MVHRIEFSPQSDRDLQQLRVFEQWRIAEAVRNQLANEPDVPTRNRKCLGDRVAANFEYVPPLWELRAGEFRVFYEIDAQTAVVYIHVVRHKPPTRTTEEVLNETDDD